MKSLFKNLSMVILTLPALTFSALGVTPARAASILYVTPTGTGDCSSWANARTLQTALTTAVSGDEIWVAAGTHKPTTGSDRTATFQLKDGVAVYGGFAGTETARDQRDFDAYVTILSGDLLGNDSDNVVYDEPTRADNSYHVVSGTIGASLSALDGFTITAGNANGDQGDSGMYNLKSRPMLTDVVIINALHPISNGGGIYNNGSSPILVNITFRGNSALYFGGGMHNTSNSSPKLMNITFSNNSASWSGGGIYNDYSNPKLTNVVFSNNEGYNGGGMYNYHSNPELMTVTFNNNLAEYGGGMKNYYGSPTLTNVAFYDNSALIGGGMGNDAASNPTLINVTFSSNSADNGGGMNNGDSNPTLRNVVFDNNTAGIGGGMFNHFSSPTLINVTFSNNSDSGMFNWEYSNPTLTNVTFSGNSASTGGGMNNYDNCNPTLINVTFTGNSASLGGGMANYSSNPTIINTIFWGNTDSTDVQIYNNNSMPVVSDSVVQSGYIDGTNIITIDPLLGTIGEYGGFTQTVSLLEGSSAINTGNDVVCPPVDQRGMIRPQGAHCEIGAYEYLETTFADVPTSHWAYGWIERVYEAGITGGCRSWSYCPEDSVTRAQMAILLEKSIHGSSFVPPNMSPTFGDTAGHWAKDWIEALKNDGITTGCSSVNYCPEDSVTRAQIAILLLRAKYGSAYTPPAASGTAFDDVPATYWAAAWIEQLAAEGITGGCGANNYCPNNKVTRAEMAVFLVRTFNLP